MDTLTSSVYAPYVLLNGVILVLLLGVLLYVSVVRRRVLVGRQEDESRLHRAVLDQVGDGVVFFDSETLSISGANTAIEQMLGYEPSELEGRTLQSLMDHREESNVDSEVAKLPTEGIVAVGTKSYRKKDGSFVELEVTASRISYGGRDCVCATLRDDSDRRDSETRLQEAEERFRNLVEKIPAIVYIQDIETQATIYDSPQIEEILGYPQDSHEKDPDYWENILHPDDRERVTKVEKGSTGQGYFRMEYRVKANDGRWVWVQDEAKVVLGEDGNPRFWQGFIFDITERKESLEALQENEQRYRSLVQLSPDAVAIRQGEVFVYMNESGLKFLGAKDAPEVVGKKVEGFIHPDYRRPVEARMRRILRGEQLEPMEQRWVRLDEEEIEVEVVSAPVSYNGEPAAQVIFRDVTERKIAERREALQKAELVRSNAELEQFAYLVAHDLRAPLRSLDGFSLVLMEDHRSGLGQDGVVYLKRIRAAAQKMSRMIDELLDLSRLTRADMEREAVDLSDISRSAAATLRSADPERRVEVLIAGGLETHGDRRLLKVAITNLMQNAWKFTERTPRARIVVGMIERGGNPTFFVRDNGVGFDMAYAGKLFNPFQRLHSDDDFEGTGIGLAAVARVIERHGGRVWAEGEPGRGATFYFTL